MREIVYILATLGLTMIVSCGGGNNSAQGEQDVQGSLRQDSIKKVEAFNDSIRRDSIAKDSIRRDSIRQDSMWRYRVTPDLAVFELHGPVKSVTASNSYYINKMQLIFDEKGKLIRVKGAPFGDEEIYEITRDKSGRIKRLSIGYDNLFGEADDALEFTYDSKNRVKEFDCWGPEWGGTYSIKYDKDGFAGSCNFLGEAEGDLMKKTSLYNNYETDEFGNWIARQCIETATVESGNSTDRQSKTYKETRKITYYER